MRFSCAFLFVAAVGLVGSISSDPALAHSGDPKLKARAVFAGPGFRRNASTGPIPFGPSGFPSAAVNLMSWLPLGEFGDDLANGNDCWGYVSPAGREGATSAEQSPTHLYDIVDAMLALQLLFQFGAAPPPPFPDPGLDPTADALPCP